MNNVLLFIRFGLLFLFIIASLREGYTQSVAPLIDSPGKTVGSDFNGDGIHDIMVGANRNDDAGTRAGAAYIFFGANNLSGTSNLGGGESADITILGKRAYDYLGISVSSAGDINGDGIDDIIVGADGYDTSGANREGAAYIFFGATNLSGTKALGGGQSADVSIIGKAAGDVLGRSVSGAGDVDGDGFDDILVGAPYNENGGINRGAAYIFFGSTNFSGTKNLGGGQSADVTVQGEVNSDALGRGVSGVGDVNGDGFDDISAGSPLHDDGGDAAGAVHIIFGASDLSGTKLAGTDHDVEILGKTTNDVLGDENSGAGDVNGDGFDDILVGTPLNDEGTGDNAGVAYLFFGASNLSGTKALGGGQSADVTFFGKANGDLLGRGVSGAGDINDDGYDDLMIGSYKNDDQAVDGGAVYIFFGATGLSGTKDLGGGASADVSIIGGTYLGRSVSGVGDVNADGVADINVGAYLNSGSAFQAGAAYIFFGATDLSGTKTGGTDQDVEILGKATGDLLGRSVGGGQDNPGP